MKLSIAIFVLGLIGAAIAVTPSIDDQPPEATRKLESQPKSIEDMDSSKANTDVTSTSTNPSALSDEVSINDTISVGMTASDVVRIHGNHYRDFLCQNVDTMLFEYDDITVNFHKGRVTHVHARSAELVKYVPANGPYEDHLQLSLPWRNPTDRIFTGLRGLAAQVDDSARFPTLQIDLHQVHESVP